MKKMQSGFTLIELMIVVAIIAILAAIAIPAYNGYITQSKLNASRDNFDAAHRFIKNEIAKQAAGGTAPTSLVALLNDGNKQTPFETDGTAAFVQATCGAGNEGAVALGADVLPAAGSTISVQLCDDTTNLLSGEFGSIVSTGITIRGE